jgi:hypothetical protein
MRAAEVLRTPVKDRLAAAAEKARQVREIRL